MSESTEEKEGRKPSKLGKDALLGQEVQAVGKPIPNGQYPGALVDISDPFVLNSKFGESTNIDLIFVILDEDGDPCKVKQLVNIPDGGLAGGLHINSKLYKTLKGVDPKAIDDKGRFAKGTTLATFLGKHCAVTIENKNDFPQVVSVQPKMAGMNGPTKPQIAQALQAESKL